MSAVIADHCHLPTDYGIKTRQTGSTLNAVMEPEVDLSLLVPLLQLSASSVSSPGDTAA